MRAEMGVHELRAALATFAAMIRENHDLLTNLDCAAGDGDHGTTMLRGAERIEEGLEQDANESPSALLSRLGWEYIGLDGGASGPLIGSLLVGMSEGCGERAHLDAAAVAAMFAGGLHGFEKRTKAKLGDKTMLDALIPGVEAMHRGAARTGDITEALEEGARAAQAGAEKTKDLVASFGRAKSLGTRAQGHQDPGATTIALFFGAFAHSFREREERQDG